MGMTNRQFQGFIRAILALAKIAAKESPENEPLKEIIRILEDMLEDGTD